jgi:large subunit ribosomal protein L10
MALTKEQKQKIVKDIGEKLEKQKAVAFVDFTGTKVKNISSLREEMKRSECEFKVAKKTLLGIAFKEKKVEIPKNLQGEIALGFGYGDQIMPFKILNKFAKETGTIKFLGGLIENKIIGAETAGYLAEIPSKEVLLAQAVGSIKSPISGFLNALHWNLRSLIYILGAIKK